MQHKESKCLPVRQWDPTCESSNASFFLIYSDNIDLPEIATDYKRQLKCGTDATEIKSQLRILRNKILHHRNTLNFRLKQPKNNLHVYIQAFINI